MKNIIIFTDLDGTLLDCAAYSFEKALPALALIKEYKISLVICSSKTRAEIEYYRKKLDNHHPFVSENGGGIFLPKNYFDFPLAAAYPVEENADYDVIRLGARYSDLRNTLSELQRDGFDITGFGDMTAIELADMANMKIDEARMAKERDFDEPFAHKVASHELPRLFSSITQKGFTYTQGRFFHILGNSDKGKAATILIDLYKRKYGDIETIALGDSPNDIPMLNRVDQPIIVQKHDGAYDPRIDMPNLMKAGGIGPDGWNRAVTELLKHYQCDEDAQQENTDPR